GECERGGLDEGVRVSMPGAQARPQRAWAGGTKAPPLATSHIYVAAADQPGTTELGGSGLIGFEPAWSPDGRKIAFKTRDPDALWLMGVDGSDPHRLTTTPGSGKAFENAQWSPACKQLF